MTQVYRQSSDSARVPEGVVSPSSTLTYGKTGSVDNGVRFHI